MNVPARQRFARFRGLRSFRTSPWDAKENLPLDYSRTIAFENPKRTAKRLRRNLLEGSAAPGTFVVISIPNFPVDRKETLDQMFQKSVIVAAGLLQFENRLSINHFRVQRHPDYEEPIQSKQMLIVHSGFRTFASRITFSEDNPKCDKFKMERFFHFHRTAIATCYGPVMFPPAPVLIFYPDPKSLSPHLSAISGLVEGSVNVSKDHANNALSEPLHCGEGAAAHPILCGTGSSLGVDPDRVVLKKIILSGFPLRVKKRHAVVRYMFFSPEDVRWFKPVDVWTKRGRKGCVREPLGTHGTFKATFDGQIHSNDVVCMSLYKRAFPKYHPIIYTCVL
eukprot:c11091_g2_i3.p1 GENE.c11091_g2_i3~~c11091_g2_i3.p1  ORF type:complete len:336 (-),score=61.80 c11091_g2_i3:176-1183(-)